MPLEVRACPIDVLLPVRKAIIGSTVVRRLQIVWGLPA
jgi:hypothetical protein